MSLISRFLSLLKYRSTIASLWICTVWQVAAVAQEPEVEAVVERFGNLEGKTRVFAEPFVDQQFTLGANEVVVFVGQENMVRLQKSGELEARLAMAFAAQRPQFRSMAWEGDTVYEQRRELNFGSWEDQLKAVDATVVIAQFGQMELLDGPERLPEFIAAYHRLLDRFATKTRRVVLIPPVLSETGIAAIKNRSQGKLARPYVDAIKEIAAQRSAIYVDLFADLVQRQQKSYRAYANDDGIHLNPHGCETVAYYISQDLCGGMRTLPGFSTERFPSFPQLRDSIAEKNRLWFNCWRPMNWAFTYGDRTTQLFGQPIENQPWLKEELATYKSLIQQEEERIFALANGEEPAVRNVAAKKPAPDPSEDPAAALEAMQIADGYAVNLFASEANGVVNPVQIAWDADGRLYVACSPTYPHIIPGAQPADYILVCHDTDEDGIADEFQKYAEGLFMVQGLELGDGGLYVCAGTELLHLRDTDGDDRADEQMVVLSGFGTGDAHQLINSISRGPEGNYWFTQGLHVNSVIETPHGIARLEKSGVWRWNPRTLKLTGFFNGAKAGHNCWGVAFDDYHQPFHKSGDRPDGYWMLPGLMEIEDPAEYHPTGALFQAPAKTTALDFIGTRHLPGDVQGCAVLGGFMGNTVDLYRVLDDGAGFKSERLPELVKSSDEAFRPVDVSIGPDGAVYVCDFHNRLIGHYQTSYRDPGRDHSHGRIWRITAKGGPRVEQPNLAAMEIDELMDQLKSPERWTRYQAKGLLFDKLSDQRIRNKISERADAKIRIAPIEKTNEQRYLIELASLLGASDHWSHSSMKDFGSASSHHVRAIAARHANEDALQALISDLHPRVRLEAISSAINRLSPAEAFPLFLKCFDKPRDRFMNYTLTNAARVLRPYWQPLAASGKRQIEPDILVFLQNAAGKHEEKPPGQIVYENLCLNCHQADAKGLPGIYPPLAQSDWVTGTDTRRLIEIIIRGAQGPVEVNEQTFYNVMPPSGLDDHRIAAVLTYIRSSFGNNAPAITADQVKQVRSQIPADSGLWSEDAE